MDCQTALRVLDICRPAGDEFCDAEVRSATAHLEECSDCLAHFRTRQSFDTQVSGLMKEVVVPAGLRDLIDQRISRRQTRRLHLRLAPLAAAATVTLAAGVWLFLQQPGGVSPVPVNKVGETLAQAQVDDARSIPAELRSDAAAAVAWCRTQLRQLRLSAEPPRRWPLAFLTAVGGSSIESGRIAVFQYDDPRGPLDVFAFPHRLFDLGEVTQRPQPIHRTRNLVVIAWSEQETTYVAVLKNWTARDWQQLTGQGGGGLT